MPIYSHSRLSSFEQCPLKFKYKYIDNEKVEIEQSIEAFLGSTVHSVLEKLYKDLKFKKENSLKDLIAYFNSEWEKNIDPNITIVNTDYSADNHRKRGEQFIKDYYNKYHPFDQTRTIGLEQKIMIRLDGKKKYFLQGFIDRLTTNGNGVFEIHDYKTSAHLTIQEDLNKDRQLALYAIAVKEMYPSSKVIRLVWHFLAFNQEMKSYRKISELNALKKETVELIERIESTREFEPQEGRLCDWCEFCHLCPKRKHLHKTEKMRPKKFFEDEGVNLVNKYSVLNSKIKEMGNELDELKSALFDYSKQYDVENVAGSDVIARIRTYENARFPSATDADRPAVEKIIRNARKWDDFSSLNVFALSKAVKEGTLDPELVKKLQKFVRLEETKRIYLGKKETEK